MKRVQQSRAYVLHRRAYRETSALVDIFTPDHGRLTVIARGVRQTKSNRAGLLQPFTPLWVSWVGRSDLMTLTDVELRFSVSVLKGEALFSGFYLNELLVALLERFDPHPRLFDCYEQTLQGLYREDFSSVLREFEHDLLTELGYGLFPRNEALLQQQFTEEKSYVFTSELGFVLDEQPRYVTQPANVFLGSELLAMAKRDWRDAAVLQSAKRLSRLALQPLLGARQLHSRQLFIQPLEVQNER